MFSVVFYSAKAENTYNVMKIHGPSNFGRKFSGL